MMTYGANAQSRDRMLIAATWLIGLGSVLLIREISGWSWQQAWPLFIIYAGTAGAVTAVINRHHSRLGVWSIWWPLAVVAVGIVVLLATTGSLGIGAGQLIQWWPLAVIALGVWFLIGAIFVRQPPTTTETVNIPLAGLTDAEVKLRFGGGELTVGRAEPGALISGNFEGGVFNHSGDPRRVDLESAATPWGFWWDRPLHWDVLVTDQIPVSLRLETGASRSNIDLTALRIPRLELKTGVSETRLRVPASGSTSARVEAGVASVNIEVPEGVSATIRSKMGLGATNVDERRFPRFFDGWASPDYQTAANRVEIDVQGGLGSVRIS